MLQIHQQLLLKCGAVVGVVGGFHYSFLLLCHHQILMLGAVAGDGDDCCVDYRYYCLLVVGCRRTVANFSIFLVAPR